MYKLPLLSMDTYLIISVACVILASINKSGTSIGRAHSDKESIKK